MYFFCTLCTFPLRNSVIIIVQLLELCLADCSGNVCVQEVGLWASRVGTYGRCVRIRLILHLCDLWKWWEYENIFLRELLLLTWGKDVIGTLCILL